MLPEEDEFPLAILDKQPADNRLFQVKETGLPLTALGTWSARLYWGRMKLGKSEGDDVDALLGSNYRSCKCSISKHPLDQ